MIESYCPKCAKDVEVASGESCPVCTRITIRLKTIEAIRGQQARLKTLIADYTGKLQSLDSERAAIVSRLKDGEEKLAAMTADYPEPEVI